MTSEIRAKCLIIGGGPAGYTAALYAARAGLAPVVIEGLQAGGQLMITTDVENWPGDLSVLGPVLMERMQAQAKAAGASLVADIVTSVDFASRPFHCRTDRGDDYIADTVVIATGAQAKWLGLPSEQAFMGSGVSGCAVCDGTFFRGLEVLVVGGGNTAVEDALYLTHHAKKVTLVHRRDHLRAEKVLQDRLFANPKVSVIWNHAVEEVIGVPMPRRVTGARIRDTLTGEVSILAADGVFIAIGHKPATELFAGQLALDAGGYIVTRPDSTATEIAGVFAAGDVRDKVYRQAVTAAGNGCMAALEVEKFLALASQTPNLGLADHPRSPSSMAVG